MKIKLLYSLFFVSFFQIVTAQNVSLDTSFGVDGKVVNTSLPGLTSILQQTDGKIIGFIQTNYNPSGNQDIVRFNSDGSLDTSFGINGIVETSLVDEITSIDKIKLQDDGKIVMVGGYLGLGTFGIVRLNPNGSLDATFGTNGYVVLSINGSPSSVEIDSIGRILVGGNVNTPYSLEGYTQNDICLLRLLPNGALDTTFGVNGLFKLNIGTHTILTNLGTIQSGGFSSEDISSMEINENGDIFLGGLTTANESIKNYANFFVVSVNQNGVINSSFGDNGRVIIDFGIAEYVQNIKFDNENNIVVCGYHYTNVTPNTSSYPKIALAKLNLNGVLDSSFGIDGKVLTNRNSSNIIDIVYDFIIDENNKILCIGASVDDAFTNVESMLIRFTENGTIDATFNGTGYSLTDFNNNSDDYGSSILMLNDGEILVGGKLIVSSSPNFVSQATLARYNLTNLSTSQFSKSQFSVSPNPFTTSINLTFSLPKNEILTIYLVDANGRLIQNLSNEKAFSSGNNSLNLDLPETLSKGIYFLKISNGFENNTIKIIK